MDPESTAGVRVGDVLAGKYRIDRILGIGGMGVVVAAHHLHLDERVAIKFMLPEALLSQDAVARFSREARAAVKVKSEHVARVTDVGTLENGAPYMVMEYLEGRDLSAWLEQSGPMPIEQAVEFVLQACEALAEAHALGIVHRDLKPANLFVIRGADGMPSVKVLDFGISKLSDTSMNMTRTTAVMGSPLYMSPEQMRSSKDADARSDIWAIGVILYELLTGEPPFNGETMPELIVKVTTAEAPMLRNGRPDAPEALQAVVLRCLDKDRGRRFQTIGEVAQALLPFGPKRARVSVERISGIMRQAGFSATAFAPPSSDDPPVREAVSGTQQNFGRTTLSPPRSRAVPVVAGFAIVALGTIGVISWIRLPEPEAQESSQTPSAAVDTSLPVPAKEPALPAEPSPPLAKTHEEKPEPAASASAEIAEPAPPPATAVRVAPAPPPKRVGAPTRQVVRKPPLTRSPATTPPPEPPPPPKKDPPSSSPPASTAAKPAPNPFADRK